ncbi:MAG: fatty acid desaturase family protein [Steroidobacteraceae bacterium]
MRKPRAMTGGLANPTVEACSGGGAARLELREAREMIKDLFRHDARIYWTDFLLSLLVAYGAAALYLSSPAFSARAIGAFAVAVFALFRCGVFIHEIVHMPGDRLRTFRVAWNVLFAVPALMPSFTYESHLDHHNPRRFGTAKDGEYLALGTPPARRIVLYLLQVPLLPALAIFRFLALTPVSFLHPRLRRVVRERASSYAINPGYRRVLGPNQRPPAWTVALEIAIFLELASFLALIAAGTLTWLIAAQLYALGTCSAGLNGLRTLAAHRYRNTGATMSFAEQIEDSITIDGQPLLTALLFPLGLRYHALHHWFPALPYHSLGRAHRRLMAQLPADSPYRHTMRTFLGAARDLCGAALQRRAA